MDINVIAPVNQLGFGIVSLNMMKALHSLGYRVAWWPIGEGEVGVQEDADLLQEYLQNAQIYNVESNCLRIFQPFDMAQRVGKGSFAGYTFFETDKFTSVEKHQLSGLDYIFVPSQWAKNVVLSQLSDNDTVHIVPAGVDMNVFYYEPNPENEVARATATKFLNIGKWEVRKGHDVLLEAFNKAFVETDDVMLLMVNYNPFISQEDNHNWARLYKETALGSKIHLFPPLESQHILAGLMQSVDCGVFPARAEGWNLEVLEMMACGKWIITTNYSGHTEYVNNANSLLIQPESFEAAYDGVFFDGNRGNWMSFTQNNVDELVEHMRIVHQRKQLGNLLANVAGIDTAKSFSWLNSAQRVMKILS